MFRSAFLFLLFLLFPVFALATPIEFDLRDDAIEDVDGESSFTLTRSGITASFSTPDGVLNRTSSGFGVNADGAGDDTDTIDDGTGIAESIEIIFADAIRLLGITVSAFGSLDLGELSFGTGTQSITTSGFLDTGLLAIPAGGIISISTVAGNGFSLDSVSVEPDLTATSATVPEPGTFWLLLSAGLVMFRKNISVS